MLSGKGLQERIIAAENCCVRERQPDKPVRDEVGSGEGSREMFGNTDYLVHGLRNVQVSDLKKWVRCTSRPNNQQQ